MNKKHIYFALVAFLLSCGKTEKETTVATKPCLDENFQAKLAFVTPELKAVSEGIHLTGSIESNPDKVVDYVSLVSGIITKTSFSLGDRVQKGQVLAELKSASLTELQSESQSVNAQIKIAERKLTSVQSMFADGIASQRELTEAQNELEILKAQKTRAASNMSLYNASDAKGVFQIKAPASGIITEKNISTGTQITDGTGSLFTVADLTEIWVMVNVYATNVRNVEVGMDVNITTLSYPDETFHGRITNLSQILDEEARVLKARVVLPNPNFKLKPGMLVDVTTNKKTGSEALSVPTDALVFDNNQNYVVVYKDNCNVAIKKVNVVASNYGTTFFSGDLQTTDKIISKNQLLVYERFKNILD